MEQENQLNKGLGGNNTTPSVQDTKQVNTDDKGERTGNASTIDIINSVATAAVELKKSGLTDDVTNLYHDCAKFRGQTKAIKAMSKVQLANIVAKFQICQQFLTSSFNERNNALQKYYKVLDDAVKSGDRELIILAMGNISNIVTSSPLTELQELCKRFDDPKRPLLDF